MGQRCKANKVALPCPFSPRRFGAVLTQATLVPPREKKCTHLLFKWLKKWIGRAGNESLGRLSPQRRDLCRLWISFCFWLNLALKVASDSAGVDSNALKRRERFAAATAKPNTAIVIRVRSGFTDSRIRVIAMGAIHW